jgi:inorganic pyrophosphatase/manganese-dependent inorganic pyrophosphatase
MMKVVTAGFSYLDIDAYAGCIAYAELLRLQGHDALAVSTANLNESITKTIKSWPVQYLTSYVPQKGDSFILVDISEPDHFDKFVTLDNVEMVIDHHSGLEQFWRDAVGDNAKIEFIGAAATLVFEEWQRADLLDQMSAESAALLMSAILDNTLNFKASVTTERDRAAYEKLKKIAKLPGDWPAQYFNECQSAILADLDSAIKNDSKMLGFEKLSIKPIAVGQLVVWDAKEIIEKYQDIIKQVMEQKKPEWFMNVVSISEGKSYFITDNDKIKTWATQVLNAKFNDSVAEASRLWLRKEIIKASMI